MSFYSDPQISSPQIVVKGGLTRWRRGLARVLSGGGDAKLLFLGDSSVSGVGAQNSGTQGAGQTLTAQIASRLNGVYPAAQGLGIPESFINGSTDSRWTKGANWAPTNYGICGAGYQASSSSNNNLVYQDPLVLADRFDVYYLTNNGGLPSISMTATGGSTVSATDPNTGQIWAKATLSAASATKTNSVTMQSTGGFVTGVEPWLSTQSRIRVANGASSGAASADFAGRTSSWNVVSSNFFSLYKADLVVISIGSNDAAAGVTAATVVSNLNALISTITAADSDVLLMTPFSVSSTGTANMITGNPVIAAAQKNMNVSYLDTYSRQDGTLAATRGMMWDGNHRNALGYGDMAQGIATALLNV